MNTIWINWNVSEIIVIFHIKHFLNSRSLKVHVLTRRVPRYFYKAKKLSSNPLFNVGDK
jgi:hypothetical protein